jgi:hypothetical protein
LPPSDQIALATGLISGTISLIALAVALFAIRKGNKNSSAAILVTLNDSFRQAWQRFLAAEDETSRQHEFAELLNVMEIACAIYLEKSLAGVSRKLAEEYISHILTLLESNDDAQERLASMINSPTMFEYIAGFRAKMRRLRDPHKISRTQLLTSTDS